MAERDPITEAPVSTAKLRHLPLAERKVRVVAELVRGKTVGEALGILEFTQRAGSSPLAKLIRSARESAESNPKNQDLGIDGDSLTISHLSVDGATILWRWRPRAYGRASRIRKRSCHINLELSQA